jgi:predicted nucleotidyltransferase
MLSYIFSTEERISILNEVLFRRESTVNEISLSANVNKGLVSIFIRKLVDFNILKKKGRIISPVESSFTKQIKVLLNLEKIRNLEFTEIQGMGLFGSWADGTNFQDSDIDMWLKLEKEQPLLIGTLIQKISRATGKEPDLLILTEERWINIKENDKPFFDKIINNNITVFGEDLE